ncbi:hypothetical protein BOTBODRAFT_186901 [Botryobasidium botryosum FD-172 SS1]|uniref:DUF1996 domain-containing protein n=1 Tax=Botryobasidium botryosum (strain FD-172 SS1) TaxID=930990 RepID=A0A067MJD0_BOTB1|nr:hypothetical protein BOTBODRAFT_186901 [Botryobasidium botryosum FD-172 SS1]
MLRPSFTALLTVILSTGVANAWFRLPCTLPMVQERIDPIVNPNQSPSQHVHTVHGGVNFYANTTYDSLRKSSCTNCLVRQDLSNYWFPKLYFHDRAKNTFEPVPDGGLLVYYQNRGTNDVANGGKGLKAFPKGFRMISGNPAARTKQYARGEGSQAELRERAIEWACLGPQSTYSFDLSPKQGFPTTNCQYGLNARIHMPACWDGVNLDSADHRSHVAHLSGLDNGACPSTHPVGLIRLFYEVTWRIDGFASRWKESDGWPFVYATGDPTGHSWHGDFFNGWDVDVLQRAIDTCNSTPDQLAGVVDACPIFNIASQADAGKCKKTTSVAENVETTLTKLPGCNPLQYGPGDATIYSESNCPK